MYSAGGKRREREGMRVTLLSDIFNNIFYITTKFNRKRRRANEEEDS